MYVHVAVVHVDQLSVPKEESPTTGQIVDCEYTCTYCLSSNVAVTNDTFLLDLHSLQVCLKASKQKEEQLWMQLETAQHEYQDKEQQCSKLEHDLYDMEKGMAVVTDELKQCMIVYTHYS